MGRGGAFGEAADEEVVEESGWLGDLVEHAVCVG